MKVYVNKVPVEGPWGGGNIAVSFLTKALKESDQIVYTSDLTDDVDVIFCFDPRHNHQGKSINEFIAHKKNHGSRIIQRVGDVGSHSKPHLTKLIQDVINSNAVDCFVFTSHWAKNYFDLSQTKSKLLVVENGSNPEFFKQRDNLCEYEDGEKIRVVTHHWSNNDKKGFDFYSQICEMCLDRDDLEFTYVGRVPSNFKKEGMIFYNPVPPDVATEIISESHIYVTASKEEAGANHVLEAMAVGIPVLYRRGGGSIDEYCNEYGISFTEKESFLSALKKCIDNYSLYRKKVQEYSRTSIDAVNAYLEVIKNV